MSATAKLCDKGILCRLWNVLEAYLDPAQNGFRPARSTVKHLSCMRRLAEGCRTHNMKACVVFIDFAKAFNPFDTRFQIIYMI